jgi:predicted negative regulator of RcsB-dependent stress response
MQAQDSTTLYLLKLWPWLEENKKGIIAGVAIVFIIGFFVWFSSVQHAQKEIAAGVALTQLVVAPDGGTADAYLKVASDYSGTIAAQRAEIQAATMLFDDGRYDDAEVQFQNIINANQSSQFYTQALLGSAACLEAQGKPDQAIPAYQLVINGSGGTTEVNAAKFAIANIQEAQGHISDAVNNYADVAASDLTGSLGGEARQRLAELRPPPQAPAQNQISTPATAAPSTSNH